MLRRIALGNSLKAAISSPLIFSQNVALRTARQVFQLATGKIWPE